jgi:hypothetical protein
MIMRYKKISRFSMALVLACTFPLIACTTQPSHTEAETEDTTETQLETPSEETATATKTATPAEQEAQKIAIFKSYQRAAAQGNARAQYNLGLWYEEDHPKQPRDLMRAYVWYKLSASQGASEAQYAFERFEAQLTPEQRAAAQRLINRWTTGDTLEK